MSKFLPTAYFKNIIRHLPHNSKGRDFVVGDLHMEFDLLRLALHEVEFNPGAGDRLISCGDLLDRGRQWERVTALLRKTWFHCVLGNHEEFFLGVMENVMPRHARSSWSEAAGILASASTFASFGAKWMGRPDPDTLETLHRLLSAQPLIIEVGSKSGRGPYGALHAEVLVGITSWPQLLAVIGNPRNPDHEDAMNSLLWGRDRLRYESNDLISGVDLIYGGHTVLDEGEPRLTGNMVHIDTGARAGPGAACCGRKDCPTWALMASRPL